MDDLHRRLQKNPRRFSWRQFDTAASICYALFRSRALGRYLDDGAIDIENSGS